MCEFPPAGSSCGHAYVGHTHLPQFTDLALGFVLVASNTMAGVLSDVTRSAGFGNVGCFAGGAMAALASGLLLLLFSRFGDLGKDELVAKRGKGA